MSVTSDSSSTASDNDARERAERAMRNFDTPPRSPYEALEPARPPEFPEREPWRSHPVLAFFNALFTLTFFTVCVVFVLFYFFRVQFDRPGPLPTSTVVVIPKGEGVSGIAERLERDEVITDRGLFMTSIIYFMYLRGTGALKAGEYEFRKNASMRQVLDTLVEGKSIAHKVTLAEGLTSQQIVERIDANPDLKGSITAVPAEGTLLPDTYRFQIGDSRQDIIERMQVAQKKFLAKMWEERDPDIIVQTPEEAIILASIVEKETSRADERPLIASVYQNRLRKKMRLQSDPTIIYGLPPGPIANPGRAAIEAVLKPAKTKDLYFVADGSGGHAFAASLDEHNKNVVKWRQVEKAMREQERAEAAAAAAGTPSPDGGIPKMSPGAPVPATGTVPGAAPGTLV